MPRAQPIQTASDASTLIFLSQYGAAASVTPVEHKVVFNAAAKTLVDSTYPVASGSAPNWVFSTTASSTNTLLTNAAQSGSKPVFQYFAYEPYTDVNGNAAMMLLDGSSPVPGTTALPNPDPLSVAPSGLSATDASNTAEVMINVPTGVLRMPSCARVTGPSQRLLPAKFSSVPLCTTAIRS